ncbi:hypothetical protein [Burkholderia cepacia]|nr:hypothetical protein [Burkholderia cepacia]
MIVTQGAGFIGSSDHVIVEVGIAAYLPVWMIQAGMRLDIGFCWCWTACGFVI